MNENKKILQKLQNLISYQFHTLSSNLKLAKCYNNDSPAKFIYLFIFLKQNKNQKRRYHSALLYRNYINNLKLI